ncbi:MAG: hypothetical protein DWQ34_01735 [Planctomycetota bacterium]|nr:MAG: hypothetical protein DWQ29_04335 [Planctomycetota bacterium]REJ97629.1 MAG: hypothetical protein DWQ34_01735 [Planctomycetota bacterium]REK22173.1 MAG: hypothetical protein DWQ41_19710 [Planctomycetota bacterium]REK35122.1 MAG: hypothetical protein DWQ45_12245 [Planctomycetota bacterium]
MNWQTIATLICIAAAILFIARRLCRLIAATRGGSASGTGCTGCSTGACGPEVVSLSPTPKNHDRD